MSIKTTNETFDLECSNCGECLKATFEEAKGAIPGLFKVAPCEKCLNDSYEEGMEDAY